MKDAAILRLVAMPSVVAMYAIYTFSNPGVDGYAFGSMMLVLGALAGIKITEGIQRQT